LGVIEMKIRRVLSPLGVLCAAVFALSGCLFTGRPPLELEGNPIHRAATGDFHATLRFMDDETLAAKYRKETNPFLSDYYSVQFKRIMVFELTLENQSDRDAQFILNRVELVYGGKTITPYNQFQLQEYWKFKDEQRDTRGLYVSMRENVIKKNVLPNSTTLSANGAIKGYLVFLGNTPTYGEAVLYIPIYRTTQEELALFEFSYKF
jgi:hypothetical protein